MRRFLNTPVSRVLGSALSWLLFASSFALLYRVSGIVMGLGGYCASGGPYVIETECPEAVVILAPLSIFGGFLAVGVALVFARGFGTPLVIWAWPILFVGLGIDFLLASFVPGGVANLVVAIVFLVMGAAPLLFVLRVGARRLVIGTTDARGRAFRDARGATPIFGMGVRGDDESARPATAGDWLRALVVSIPAIGIGIWLADLVFAAMPRAA